MIVLHKSFIGLILFVLVAVFPPVIKPVVQAVILVNAGKYIALPESMAWQCADVIKKRHSRQIDLAETLDIDPVIRQQMTDFAQADYRRDLKESCDIDDPTALPDRDTLREIKP